MSSQNGFIVFTATPEMAQQTKVFKAGVTYVAQRAVAVAQSSATSSASSSKTAGRTKTAAKKKKIAKRAVKKTATKKRLTKKVTKKAAVKLSKRAQAATAKRPLKATARSAAKPEIIVQYVRDNEGCNMTDIERSTKLPQATIRRILNTAREGGEVRTEGQRRGLRYYSGAGVTPAGGAADDDTPEGGW